MVHHFPAEHPFHAVEEEVAIWAAGLDEVAERIAGRFTRSEPRNRALAYIRGLLSSLERKNGWQLAEEAGESSPDNFQHLLNRAEWDAGRMVNDLQGYVVDHLGSEHTILVLDETGFLKKGDRSAGVARQYSGTAGRIENCQVGVFLAYANAKGHALIDRALYVPQAWLNDRERCKKAGIPESAEFLTKPQLAKLMLERALENEVPFSWVTADEVYGSDRKLRLWMEAQAIPYVMAVRSDEPLWRGFGQQRVKQLLAELEENRWFRASAGDGSKGPRMYDWAVFEVNSPPIQGWRRWLLVRRSLAQDKKLAYYLVCAPKETRLPEMIQVAGSRWAIEECFESAKGEVGLDEYEVRRWDAWHRHMTLAMLAFAFLAVSRSEANLAAVAKGGSETRQPRSCMSEFKRRRGLACP